MVAHKNFIISWIFINKIRSIFKTMNRISIISGYITCKSEISIEIYFLSDNELFYKNENFFIIFMKYVYNLVK